MKRLLIAGAAVVLVGLAALTIGGAVTSAQEGDGPFGSFMTRLAEKLGVTEEELKIAVQETRIETIDEALERGLITEDQAERLRERAEEGHPIFHRHHRFGVRHLVVNAVVEVLGVTKEDLKQKFHEGNSLAELAEEQGMSAQELEAALLSEVQAQLDAKVGEEKITQAQADRIFEWVEENIENIVNAEPGSDGHRGPQHGFRGFGGLNGSPFGEPAGAEEAEVVA